MTGLRQTAIFKLNFFDFKTKTSDQALSLTLRLELRNRFAAVDFHLVDLSSFVAMSRPQYSFGYEAPQNYQDHHSPPIQQHQQWAGHMPLGPSSSSHSQSDLIASTGLRFAQTAAGLTITVIHFFFVPFSFAFFRIWNMVPRLINPV